MIVTTATIFNDPKFTQIARTTILPTLKTRPSQIIFHIIATNLLLRIIPASFATTIIAISGEHLYHLKFWLRLSPSLRHHNAVVVVVVVAAAATVVVVGRSRNPRYSFVDVWLVVVVFKGSIIGGEAIVRDGRGG